MKLANAAATVEVAPLIALTSASLGACGAIVRDHERRGTSLAATRHLNQSCSYASAPKPNGTGLSELSYEVHDYTGGGVAGVPVGLPIWMAVATE